MKMIDLAKVISQLTPEETTVLAVHLVTANLNQAEMLHNYLYAQIVDSADPYCDQEHAS